MAAPEMGPSRVTRSRREARASYDRISRWYGLLEGIWERRARRLGLSSLSAACGETVLEIGCGPGYSLPELATAVGSSGRVYGIDLSPEMVARARRRVERSGRGDWIELALGDAAALPFAPDSCDAVFMSFVLELFDTPEIPLVLAECRRVLRPGGRVCVVALSLEGGPNRLRTWYEWGHRRWPTLLDCRPIFVARAVSAARFRIGGTTMTSLWGLPVEVVPAFKQP